MNEETIKLCNRVSELVPTAVEKPTLVYFDIVGIAWPIRCLLHLQEVEYDLIQISIFQWVERDETGNQVLKHCFKNGHIPLYVDGHVSLNQSQVIVEYLAEKHGLGGGKQSERLAVREVMWQAYDALFHMNGLARVNIRNGLTDELAEARLAAFLGNGEWPLVSEGFDNNLRAFDRYLQSNPSPNGYFVGDTLTVADLCAFNVLCNWYKAFEPTRFMAHYPRLEDFIQQIAAVPGVADYIAKKQEPTSWFRLPKVAMRLTSPEELKGLAGLD